MQIKLTPSSSQSDELWYGAHNVNGKVGYFSPANTVAYLGTLPSSSSHHSKWQNEEFHHGGSGGSTFQRSSLKRGSKGRKKLSRDMISGPRGELQHTGHIGLDGAFFGDVGFIGSAKAVAAASTEKFKSASLSRADSDASERAPLISSGGGTARNSSSSTATSCAPPEATFLTTAASGPLTAPAASSASAKPRHGSGGANKNPRMGKTIGYLRKAGGSEVPGGNQGGSAAATSSRAPHEYHSISDDEFGLGSLDLGPSLMDEVFSELDSSKDSAEIKDGKDEQPENSEREKESKKTTVIPDHRRDFKELVSSTLTLGKMKKQKQQGGNSLENILA